MRWSYACLSVLLLSATASAKPEIKPYSLQVSGIQTEQVSVPSQQLALERQNININAGMKLPLSKQLFMSVSAGFTDTQYDWQADNANIVMPSWDSVKRYNMSVGLSYRYDEHWMFIVAPTLQYAYTEQASMSDSDSYGVVSSAMYRFDNGNMLGVGVAYLNDLQKVRTVPYLAINWQLTDKLSLANPFKAGFSGPAGLELRYALSQDWLLALGSSRRTQRFMINQAQDVAEIEEWIGFARASYQLNQNVMLSGYAGYFVDSQWSINDDTGIDIDNQGALALAIDVAF
ncbi:hypothetical protein [Shewanella marina]|uniref:hypothetical protein n=1 Tax=Shewanella marina TaxID=487319 RepID=UPI000472C9B9|nr:hypothetical protein [Shewanella marina]